MIIDATNLILGRLASFAAKKSLLGEKIEIVNSEKAVITGNKKETLKEYLRKRKAKSVRKGPFIPKISDRFVRRSIRGMLPYKRPKGREAFKRVICYAGVPEKLKDKKFETIKEANVRKLQSLDYITVGNICRVMGGR